MKIAQASIGDVAQNNIKVGVTALKPNQIVRYAIVGYGGMGEYHQDRLLNVEGYQLAGIYDINPIRNEHAAWQGIKIYCSIQELIEDSTVNMVIISTPNDCHCQYAVDLAKAGKHIFCEKPVAMSVHELDIMLQAVNSAGVTFMVNQNRRLDRDFLVAKKIVESGILGNVYKIISNVSGGNGIPGGWRKVKAQGGGMMLDWGVHLIDQMFVMLRGEYQIKRCEFSYALGHEVDDGFEMDLRVGDCIDARIIVDTNTFIHRARWMIFGTNGSAIIEDWDCNGEIVLSKGIDKKLKGIHAGNGFTKTMAKRSADSLTRIPLPTVDFDPNDIYNNLRECIFAKSAPIIDHNTVRRVLSAMVDVLRMSDTN